AGWPLLFVGLTALPAFHHIAAPWVLFALCCAAFRGPITRRILTNRWITTIGGMCYSIYLLHYVLFMVLGRAIGALDTGSTTLDIIVYSVLLIPPVLAVGAVFFALVERPCMDPAWPSYIRAWLRRQVEGRRQIAAIEPVVASDVGFRLGP